MRTAFAATALALAAVSLAACSSQEQPVEQADANPTGLAVENARLILPAVSGNPGVIYFALKNDGDRAKSVRRADVADAGNAQIHDTMEQSGQMVMGELGQVTLQPGETMSFEPGGKHVMVFDIAPELTAGSSTEMTLTIVGGDKVTFDVPVEAPDAER